MVRTQHALRRYGASSGRLADIGSYFGNFSLMFAKNGYEVTAVDSYSKYGAALTPITNLLTDAGAKIRDFHEIGESLDALPSESFDIVLSMGVIEHVPHTPRPLLEAMNRILRPGGLLVIDTPNLGYLYTREKLSRGETIFCPIELQYDTDLPFEGHHREYTSKELRWMLDRLDHKIIDLQMFNFSMYALPQIAGIDLKKFNAMKSDPDLRELILTISQKSNGL
jgi:2-polyprenyl-3-methyl-5-hydroxy-6-metoxy-1,4-benzoquinol methylase